MDIMPKNKTLVGRARDMRHHMTKEEMHLWMDYLKLTPYHFRKQHVEAPFITDFCCKKARLMIELDGSGHYSDLGKSYDAWRTEKLERNGYAVLRFSNLDIWRNFRGVCEMIRIVVESRLKENLWKK